MPTPTKADLSYLVNVIGATQGQMNSALAGVPLDTGALSGLGLTVLSDNTTNVGTTQVERTITVSLTQPPTVSVNNPPTLPNAAGVQTAYAWTGSIASSSAADASGGAGVSQVQVNYLDLAGVSHSEVVNLTGQMPVKMASSNKSQIVSVAFLATGASGSSLGQLTVFGDPVLPPSSGEPIVAIVPPSYYVIAGGTSTSILTPDLVELLLGYFQGKLHMPVIALSPVLHN